MISIAIDGPAGAGKSSVAKALSSKLGFLYVDTGALYRSIGLYCLRKGIDTKDESKVSDSLSHIHLDLRFIDNSQHVFLNDEDVSDAIRSPEASMAASNVSAIGSVRTFLLDTQRSFANLYNIVMDGRDIGTVILPHAQVKVFLTASPEVRAKRRFDELVAKGYSPVYDDLLKEVILRDEQDTNRAIAPLKQAEDAWLLDTSNLNFEQVVTAIYDYYLKKTEL